MKNRIILFCIVLVAGRIPLTAQVIRETSETLKIQLSSAKTILQGFSAPCQLSSVEKKVISAKSNPMWVGAVPSASVATRSGTAAENKPVVAPVVEKKSPEPVGADSNSGQGLHVSFKPKDTTPPEISITYGRSSDPDKERILIIAEDKDGEIKSLKVNDSLIAYTGKNLVKFERDFLPGSELVVYAVDAFNNTAKENFSVKTRQQIVQAPPPVVEAVSKLGAPSIPKFYALIIGVANYKYSGPGLQSLDKPEVDATRLYKVLVKKYTFDSTNVTLLKSPDRRQIIDALDGLSSKLTEKDNLLIFYAGHGIFDKKRDFGYWLAADARINSTSDWIANSTIKDYLRAIPAKHTLLITDACFGGSIFKSRAVDANMIMQVADLYKDPSRRAMTSGNLSEVPDESPFIDFLVKKLDDNDDDYLPTLKLFTRIYEPVVNNSAALPVFGVVAETGDSGGDFIFIKKK